MPTIEKKPTAILATKSKYKFFLTIKYNHISFDLFADILAPSFPGESNRTIYITSIALAEPFCLSLFGEKDMAYLWHHYDIIMTSQWHNIINGCYVILLQNKKFLCRPSQTACTVMTMNIMCTQATLRIHKNLLHTHTKIYVWYWFLC